MGVDDDVRSDALTGERHVLQHSKETLKTSEPGRDDGEAAPPLGGTVRTCLSWLLFHSNDKMFQHKYIDLLVYLVFERESRQEVKSSTSFVN